MACTALSPFAPSPADHLPWLSAADQQRVMDFLGLTTPAQRARLARLVEAGGRDMDKMAEALADMPRWEITSGAYFCGLAFTVRIWSEP